MSNGGITMSGSKREISGKLFSKQAQHLMMTTNHYVAPNNTPKWPNDKKGAWDTVLWTFPHTFYFYLMTHFFLSIFTFYFYFWIGWVINQDIITHHLLIFLFIFLLIFLLTAYSSSYTHCLLIFLLIFLLVSLLSHPLNSYFSKHINTWMIYL